VARKDLRRRKLLVAVAALVPVLMVELDVAVPDTVGGKLLRTILTLEDLLFIGWMFFKPVLLKSVSPLKGLRLVFAIFVIAKESTLLLPDQVVDLGRRKRVFVFFILVRQNFAVHFLLDFVLVLVLVEGHLEPECLAAFFTFVFLHGRVVAVGVLYQAALSHKVRAALITTVKKQKHLRLVN
jgi:hypothetical protein